MVNTIIENKLFIDDREVSFTNEKNLLEVIRKAGIEVPTLCYRPDLSIFGACRMCVVEIEGRGIQASCSIPPEAGLKVKINTEKTRRIRKVVLELLLANHDRECTTCEKSENCDLQRLSHKYGVKNVRFGSREKMVAIDDSNPSIVRDPNKCILCGNCVRAYDEIQGKSVLDFTGRGSKTQVSPAFNRDMTCAECIYCGQCAAVCPTGALTIKSEIDDTWKAIHSDKYVVVQIAPAVRVAIGEEFGLSAGEDLIGLTVSALRKMGFSKVFDTTFAADLTIMEEANEFVSRVKAGKKLPLFTSCCPGWVRYAEQKYPELLENLSTCKSPQQMFGSVAKGFIAKEENIKPEDIIVVSIMPCTAKKAEAKRDEFKTEGVQDVDIVLTTQELSKMIKEAGIDLKTIKPEQLDTPFGIFTGAGVIFGASGGVMEAAVRTAYEVVTDKKLENYEITDARGTEKLKEFTINVDGIKVRAAVVNTLKAADELIQKIKSGEAQYEIIEVMACPGGCVGGAGQPQSCKNPALRGKRADGLYVADNKLPMHKSHENPEIQSLYKKWLESPNSKIAHDLLHTHYHSRKKTVE